MARRLKLIYCDKMNVAAIHVINLIDYARVRGVPKDELLMCIDHLPLDPMDESALVSVNDFYKVLEYINNELSDPTWGIKAGNFIGLQQLGLIFKISMQATTIGEAFHYLQTYLNAALPLLKSETNIAEDTATISLFIANKEDAGNRIILENILTIIAREMEMMSTEAISVRLGSPYFSDQYPTEWGMDTAFCVHFKPRILKAALQQRGHLNLEILIPEYLKLIETLKKDNTFTNLIKVTMLSMSNPQLPDIERLSETLNLSPRTLQRRLVAEKISFREVSEVLKKQVCMCLLQHDCFSITTFSYLLGYSESAAFIHAFKKWFGDTPLRMRAKIKTDNKNILS